MCQFCEGTRELTLDDLDQDYYAATQIVYLPDGPYRERGYNVRVDGPGGAYARFKFCPECGKPLIKQEIIC